MRRSTTRSARRWPRRPDAQPVALVLFDLDYLKLINDVHGHQIGDPALRAVADALRATTRECDRVARLGGDEFGALFVGVEREVVLRIAQRAVKRVCATSCRGSGGCRRLRASPSWRRRASRVTCSTAPTRRSTTPRHAAAASSRWPT